MRKIIRYFLFLFLIMNSVKSSAQKPIDINLLKPKVDSIIMEANEIYYYLNAKLVAEKIVKEDIKLNYKWVIETHDDDSIRIKFIDNQRLVIATITSLIGSRSPTVQVGLNKNLSSYEDSLLHIKYSFLSRIVPSGFGIESHDNEEIITLIIPYKENFKIYRIQSTENKNTIPFGNDFLFIVDKESKLLSWKNYHKTYGPMKTIVRGHNVRHVIPKYNNNETYILAIDIALFRLYADHEELNTLTAFPPKSKRYFTYNSQTNKLRIHTTPSN